jgi:DNA-binding NtrC family response regulator
MTMLDTFTEDRNVAPALGEFVSVNVRARILIVDDDPHFLRILQRMLLEEDLQATTCTNSCEALGLLRSGKFGLVISDLRMPGCDGLHLLEAIRNAGNKIPVIILTAYGEPENYLEALNAGATEFLNKLMDFSDLLTVVRRCLNRTSPPRPHPPTV